MLCKSDFEVLTFLFQAFIGAVDIFIWSVFRKVVLSHSNFRQLIYNVLTKNNLK